MHHVFLRSRFDILIAHRLDGFLLGFELVLEDLELNPVFRDLLLLIVEGATELAHFVFDPFFVRFEKADFLRIELVILTLLLDCIGSPIECLFLHVESLDLLLKLIVQVHHLRLFLFELRLPLLEGALFRSQVATLILCLFKFLTQLDFSLVHLVVELFSADFDLLEFDLDLLGLLNRILLLPCHQVLDALLILNCSLYFNLQVDRSVADLAVQLRRADLFLVNICVNLLLLELVLVRGFLLALGKFRLLSLNLALSLVELQSFLLEDPSSFSQVLLFLDDVLLALPELRLLLGRKLMHHRIDVT